jgi:hypothetical protein
MSKGNRQVSILPTMHAAQVERSQFCGYNQLDEGVTQKNVVFGESDFYCTLIILAGGEEIAIRRKNNQNRLKKND